eukprot:3374373-Rhodomonas_salina.1
MAQQHKGAATCRCSKSNGSPGSSIAYISPGHRIGSADTSITDLRYSGTNLADLGTGHRTATA